MIIKPLIESFNKSKQRLFLSTETCPPVCRSSRRQMRSCSLRPTVCLSAGEGEEPGEEWEERLASLKDWGWAGLLQPPTVYWGGGGA